MYNFLCLIKLLFLMVRIKTCLIKWYSYCFAEHVTEINKKGWLVRFLGEVIECFGYIWFKKVHSLQKSSQIKGSCLYYLQVYFYIGRSCVKWQLKSYVLQLYKLEYHIYMITMHVWSSFCIIFASCVTWIILDYILLSSMYMYCKLK